MIQIPDAVFVISAGLLAAGIVYKIVTGLINTHREQRERRVRQHLRDHTKILLHTADLFSQKFEGLNIKHAIVDDESTSPVPLPPDSPREASGPPTGGPRFTPRSVS